MRSLTDVHSETQLNNDVVEADGRPPTARFCSRFQPVKRKLFLAAVAKCLLMVGTVVSLQ